jgi:Wadjet anti plasmid transformation system JetA-like protein
VGQIEHEARGVLVIENADVLKQVCLHAGISDRWLCVWGNGSVQDGIIAFLKLMNNVPIAVWGDLDAYGIQIIDSMALRLGRAVIPVGMSVDLYTNGTKYTPKDLPDSLNVARRMAATGIEGLRDLAQAIVATGGLGCEQEALYAKVLPALAQQLAALE